MRAARRRHALRRNGTAYLFLAPFLVCWTGFLLVPALWVVRQSFMQGGVLGPAHWVGLDNWRQFFSDQTALHSLATTLRFAAIAVPALLALAMVLALLLREARRGGGPFRSMIYFPALAPIVLSALVWTFMVHPDFGLLNVANRSVGFAPINWLGDPALALIGIVMLEVWRGAGFWALFLLAALLAVPNDLYDAGKIDGASSLRRFWHITLPTMRAPVTVAVVLTCLATMQVFDPIFVLTQGGPSHATESAVFYIYESVFENGEPGYGAVLSLILLAVIVGLTLVMARVLRAPRKR